MFGKVTYVDAVVDGEIAFTTESMSEAEFEEKSAKINLINRIRLG